MKNTDDLSPPQRLPRFFWLLAFLGLAGLLGLAYFQVQKAKKGGGEHNWLDHYGAAPTFELWNQQGEKVSLKDLQGAIWVVDFIFTRCQGPCPLLTARLAQISEALKGQKNVKLVSVTVDPDYDVPHVLKEYAQKFHADPQQWSFLTGTKEQVEAFMVKGMLQPIIQNAPAGPIHSTQLIVVDPQGQIRAFRDGTDPHVVAQILADIRSLKNESAGKEK